MRALLLVIALAGPQISSACAPALMPETPMAAVVVEAPRWIGRGSPELRLGAVYAEHEDWTRARDAWKRAVRSNDARVRSRAHLNLAALHRFMGEEEQAWAEAARALAAHPQSHRARVFWSTPARG